MSDDSKPIVKSDRELLREFSHEIRTPLNAMLGFSTLIMDGLAGKPLSQDVTQDYAGRINSSTLRLLQICERVLDQAVEGHTVVKKEDVDFTEFCTEIIGTFEIDAKEKGIALSYSIDASFPTLHTDPVILFEIMSNLISNAIKFTPKGGLVIVKGTLDHKNNSLILVIQDTGKGIPATILMGLMKGERPTTSFAHSSRKGWGLGIGIVKEKASLLGGVLEISNAPGGGTVACIRLPNIGT